MGYNVKKDTDYKATSGGQDEYRPFPPLEAGSYTVDIYEVKSGEYKSPANKGKPNIRIQFRVSDGQKGANRRLFNTIGIFEKWGPTSKNPEGSDNFSFFNFFAAVTGRKEKEFRAWFEETEDPFGELPGPRDLEGMPVTAVVKVVEDSYGFDKALASFAQENDLDIVKDRPGVIEAFTKATGYTAEDYKGNEISSFKVSDGKPIVAESGSSSKVEAVEL